ncbi:hypothetical protein H7097_01755 [Aeromicrobium sp.]|nr:hypothetical protein [Candidatus Saccharibacteria bacterium]
MSKLPNIEQFRNSTALKVVAIGLGAATLAGCTESNNTNNDLQLGSQTIKKCPDGFVSTKATDNIADTKNAYGAIQQATAILSAEISHGTSSTQDGDGVTYVYNFDVKPKDLPATEAIFPKKTGFQSSGNYAIAGKSNYVDDLSEVFCTSGEATYFTPRAITAIGALVVAGITVDIVNGTATQAK